MKKNLGFLITLLIILIISGCVPLNDEIGPVETREPTATIQPENTSTPSQTPEVGTADEAVPLIEWQRSGGIAGLCRQLTLYPDGKYEYSDCRERITLYEGELSQEQMAPFTELANRYNSFRWEFDPPKQSADMFKDWYTFTGSGTDTPPEDEMQAINNRLAMLTTELATQTAGLDSGIRGTVMIEPSCPGPVREGATECAPKPYQAVLAILDEDGNSVTEVQSSEQGVFQVALQPGKYILRPLSGARYPFAPEQTIAIPSGKYIEVTVIYDSGLR